MHYGVPLWVPEVGGTIDPDNEANDWIVSVFGGMSSTWLGPESPGRARLSVRLHRSPGLVVEGDRGARVGLDVAAVAAGPRPYAHWRSIR
ncbi:hypothetical protein ACFPH6_05705 [Streptomyces xiangluensis]|uniref:Uncharacterized protein n=1 Tax=Streptomyces xiangluensis TaxID=2665720 RepID=A0ABV8YFK5_9ACTN